MKVLEIGLSNNLGGIERFLFNLHNNINKRDVCIDYVIYNGKLKYDPQRQLSKNIKYKMFQMPALSNIFCYLNTLGGICKYGRYDVIHIHKNSLANPLPIIVAKIVSNSKIILHSHNTQPGNYRFIGRMLHMINRCIIDRLDICRIACSDLAGDWMFKKGNYTVIHNAIDVDKFIFNRQIRKQVRDKLNISDKFVIGNVARISAQKNQKFLLEVFKEIYQKNPNAVLLLIGGCSDSTVDQCYKRDVEILIKKYKLDKSVIWLGVREDTNELYQAMDIMLMPSLFEGLCISAIEAQAAGLKCVCSDVFSKETAISSESFISVSLNDAPGKWAEIVLQNKEYLRKNRIGEMREHGFDIKNEIDNVVSLYYDTKKKG